MVFENYVKSGKIASMVRENARKKNHIGRTLFEICESIENEIISLGGSPAFPVNVSLNEIAKTIENTIINNGLKPIQNLSGHSLDQYIVHAGKSIPNIKTLGSSFSL